MTSRRLEQIGGYVAANMVFRAGRPNADDEVPTAVEHGCLCTLTSRSSSRLIPANAAAFQRLSH
jgi:hypothetical protein